VELRDRRVLVIGGAGLIGSHVVDALLRTDVGEVVVFDNFSRGRRENLTEALRDPRASVFPLGGDILQRDLLEEAMRGADGVVHLAALWLLHCHDYPESAFEVNVRGTFNVAHAAVRCGVERVVFSSSASVYGDALEVPMTEDHPYENRTFYGATKIAGEHLFRALGERYGLSWAGLRYMNVYGPRQDYRGTYTAVMHKMLDRIERGEAPVLHGDGSQTYDFVHVRDVAAANVAALRSEASGGLYNVGRGVGTSLAELARLLLRICEREDLPVRHEPAASSFVTYRIGSTERAERDLGFRARIGLEEGMRDLVAWRRAEEGRPARRRSEGGAACFASP